MYIEFSYVFKHLCDQFLIFQRFRAEFTVYVPDKLTHQPKIRSTVEIDVFTSLILENM